MAKPEKQHSHTDTNNSNKKRTTKINTHKSRKGAIHTEHHMLVTDWTGQWISSYLASYAKTFRSCIIVRSNPFVAQSAVAYFCKTLYSVASSIYVSHDMVCLWHSSDNLRSSHFIETSLIIMPDRRSSFDVDSPFHSFSRVTLEWRFLFLFWLIHPQSLLRATCVSNHFGSCCCQTRSRFSQRTLSDSWRNRTWTLPLMKKRLHETPYPPHASPRSLNTHPFHNTLGWDR